MDPFIGTITAVGFNYAPRGWAFCNGQLLSIAQNTALFSLLGTTYGGNGQTTFGLPDLQGRVPVGGQGSGGASNIQLGEIGGNNGVTVVSTGSASVTLAAANLPAHTHGGTGLTGATNVSVSTGGGGSVTPGNNSVLTSTVSGPTSAAIYAASASNPVNLGGVTTTVGGTTASTGTGTMLSAPVSVSSQPTSIMQPYLGVNYIIATQGIFPSRN